MARIAQAGAWFLLPQHQQTYTARKKMHIAAIQRLCSPLRLWLCPPAEMLLWAAAPNSRGEFQPCLYPKSQRRFQQGQLKRARDWQTLKVFSAYARTVSTMIKNGVLNK
jgi:hypothetical protein